MVFVVVLFAAALFAETASGSVYAAYKDGIVYPRAVGSATVPGTSIPSETVLAYAAPALSPPRLLGMRRRGGVFDVAAGRDGGGRSVLTYSRCRYDPPLGAIRRLSRGCDAYRYRDGREQRVAAVSTVSADEYLPAQDGARTAFVRQTFRRGHSTVRLLVRGPGGELREIRRWKYPPGSTFSAGPTDVQLRGALLVWREARFLRDTEQCPYYDGFLKGFSGEETRILRLDLRRAGGRPTVVATGCDRSTRVQTVSSPSLLPDGRIGWFSVEGLGAKALVTVVRTTRRGTRTRTPFPTGTDSNGVNRTVDDGLVTAKFAYARDIDGLVAVGLPAE